MGEGGPGPAQYEGVSLEEEEARPSPVFPLSYCRERFALSHLAQPRETKVTMLVCGCLQTFASLRSQFPAASLNYSTFDN